MAPKLSILQRPLLVGGLGLSATLWLLGTAHGGLFDSSTLLSAVALGSGAWWWRHRDRPLAPPRPIAPPVVDRARVEAQLATLKALIDTLAEEAKLAPDQGSTLPSAALTTYEAQRQAWLTGLDRQQLAVAVLGDRRTGKSTLIDWLTAQAVTDATLAQLTWQEVPLTADSLPSPPLAEPDAVLLVTDGDITDSTLALLKERVMAGQGAILVFNKQDHYDPADQQTIFTQLQQHVTTLPGPVTVVKVAAAPRPIKVRRHQADSSVEEFLEPAPPALDELMGAISSILLPAIPTLVATTTLRQVEALHQQVQTDLNQLRRRRALPIVEQLQWVAAAAAFANPVPTLDLLATVAINGQLILDLGKIYGFNLSLDEAKTAAGTLASLTVKLGLVELSTQALTAGLKSHFATYLAGGLVQGLSAAYLTRMAGLSLIDYFEQAALDGTPATALSWATIAQRLQTTVQQNRQLTVVQTLINQGIAILKPTPNPALLTPATAPAVTIPTNLTTPEPQTSVPPPLTLDTDTIPA
ncbi:MAG: DUF697 domain-containing protein [Nodosilinea sp.]